MALLIISSVFMISPKMSTNVYAKSKIVHYVKTNKVYKINGTKILTVNCKRPVLYGKSKVVKRVNNYIKNIQTKKISEMLKYSKEEYYEKKEYASNFYTPGSITDSIKLTYYKKGAYSFCEKDMGYWSCAASTYSQKIGYTFSKKTGKRLSVDKVAKKSGYTKKALKNKVVNEAKKMIKEGNYY